MLSLNPVFGAFTRRKTRTKTNAIAQTGMFNQNNQRHAFVLAKAPGFYESRFAQWVEKDIPPTGGPIPLTQTLVTAGGREEDRSSPGECPDSIRRLIQG